VPWASFGPSPDNLVFDITGELPETYLRHDEDGGH
jgi:hypothetical protein